MKNLNTFLLVAFVFFILSCKDKMEHVDLIIYNAKVYTVDNDFSIAESFAVKEGMFVEIGSSETILGKYLADEIIDLGGKPVYPGFIDAHCHFYNYGLGLQRNADLVGSGSFDEVIEILKDHHNKYPAEWILGRGWDQNDWEIKEFPDKALLDENFPGIPVYIGRIDGHAALVNSVALKIAGIDKNTVIDGGVIELKENEPSGILIDNAKDFMRKFIPSTSRLMQISGLMEAQDNCFAVGLTSIADAGLKPGIINLIDSLNKEDKLIIRVCAMLDTDNESYKAFVTGGKYKTDKLSVRSLKIYADGALGSRGACLSRPYSDDPENYGLIIKEPSYYLDVCEFAFENGFQVITHAIGDSAVRLMLKIYGDILKDTNDLRWRIEHAQVVDPEDIHLFGKYSIIPSVQATHATSDMYWAEERLGEERIKWAYTYKTLLDQNGWLPNGTDFPIEQIDPLHTFYAAVSRKDHAGYPESGFNIEDALTREEALRSVTIWAAKAAFEENEKGSIEKGKFADYVVLDKDIMMIAENELFGVKIEKTFLAGEKVYQK